MIKPLKQPKEIFLDKDIIFRFARLKVFREGMLSKQREVMRLVHEGKMKAFISNNTPFSVINHLVYKYTRTDQLRTDELRREAEGKISAWFEEIFGKGYWELVNLELGDYKKAVIDGKLLWEDAVQYQCACKTKKLPFVTENIRDFEKTDLKVYSPRNLI
ncbi:MAG: hypothetical protein HY392_05660 [Candidatus Diapherotrites archaeon]|nr:hypothetical protein [Candidatus Diapherotrites archaeon]